MGIFAGREHLRITPEESAEMMAHMEKKFITDRTPAKFKERLIALAGSIAKGATALDTEDQTVKRWCSGKVKKIPGVVWVALEGLEVMKSWNYGK